MPVNTNAVLCEDIHQTTTGQFILVGVVTGVLQTNGDNYDEAHCLFAQLSGLPEGDHKISIRLTSPDRSKTGTITDVAVSDVRSGATLIISGIPFTTRKSGTFKLDWRLDSATKWSPLAKLEIDLNVPIPKK